MSYYTGKVYAICYDLRQPGRDYSGLFGAIKAVGPWWHYLDSTWLVKTTMAPDQLWPVLSPHLDQNDFLLIIEVKNNKSGWLPKEAWDWIDANLPV